MKKRLVSTIFALCLCVSAIPNAHALQEDSLSQRTFSVEESTAGPTPYEEVKIPTYQEAYAAMIAMNEKYPEGMAWTNDTPYSDNNFYHWNGGPLNGQNIVATGCAAFAFELSDAAFGSLPARMLTTFELSNVKVGDILRVNNSSHTVIVLQASDAGVIIAEGNYNGAVHWGRSLSKDEVEAANSLITRYPEDYINPDDSTADEKIAEGSTGALTWTLTKAGTLTVSGSGAMQDFSSSADQPWNSYTDKILKIVVADGVTHVGSSAFWGSKALSVELPDSVETIGDSAFRSCPNLSSVSISEGVETIGGNTFRGCQKLGSIVLPASVGSVGAGAFMECVELKSAVFAPGSKQVTMGDNLFTRCQRLDTVALPQKMDCVSEGMFLNCSTLSSLNIPQGTDSIGVSAFASCSSLAAITIPDSVTTIRTAAFSACTSLKDIYFGGSEAQWNSIGKTFDVSEALANVTIHYNSADPGTDPDPGPDPNPGIDPNPGTGPAPGTDSDLGTDPTPEHTHSWAAAWSSNATHHWHNCTLPICTVTDNSLKDGYAAHIYSSNVDAVCNICSYIRTISDIDLFPFGSSFESGRPPATTTIITSTPITTKNPDGSTTTRTEDKTTGAITEATQNTDGSLIVVETRRDGTVTTTETNRFGDKIVTVDKPDGSSVTSVTRKDGATAAVTTSASGQTKAEVTLPATTVSEAQRTGEAIVLPIHEVRATRNTVGAPAVTIKTGSTEPVKVEIPTENVTPGTVAVIVNADGSEEVVKTTSLTESGVTVSLPDGATVKIVDNSKSFTDVSVAHWASDAINFASARELFSGITAETFSPEAPMTRAMLMTVLARYDGEDTSGGTIWYEKGVEWAVTNAISDGSNPNGNITREQLVTVLWRYSGSPAVNSALNAFADAGEISGYAQEAMRWAVEKGIITGLDSGQLDPKGQTTRAEVAIMIMRYSSNA